MSSNKLLIITSYFPPESGAASNRIFSLAEKLSEKNYDPHVVTPLPNYPVGKIFNEYKNRFIVNEFYKTIKTTRLFILASNSTNKYIRLFSILSYSFILFFYVIFKPLPKKVIIQCSPLIVGFFASFACRLKQKEIILNVSDIWPLAGLEMGILNKGTYYNLLEKLEHFIYKSANKIIGQSNEILMHVSSKTSSKNKTFFLYRNFPKFEIPKHKESKSIHKKKFVYAGLIGIAQGIEQICSHIEFPENIEFHIYGDGPNANELKEVIKNKKQVYYHGNLNRDLLHQTLIEYDFTLIPLKNRIYGSVPSKIFEFSKLGLPILFFSSGEGADIVESHKLGIAQREINFEELQQKIIAISEGDIILPNKIKVRDIANKDFDLDQQFKAFEEFCLID
ncbi:glycosyltransferase family 4 protein [Psychroflexus salis]|uniref:Glycosyltransferase WbuB n=1 Tax=Psychroflexus salis TaxID=1526574 RepID=A0A917E4G8_9FLAO|nr:glycosyltransferase family 4 protein [Psychroflexus salis]GGE02332.1 glycosyltransferase WbuB [Psychroflexus salis]